MRNINDFSIKEFDEYVKLLEEKDIEIKSILSLFGLDPVELKPNELKPIYENILDQRLNRVETKDFYIINGKKYKLLKKVNDITAAQFIDYQLYMQKFHIEQVLSIFLIPVKGKNIFGKYKYHKYNEGYDIIELQNDIYNHMKQVDANSIVDFFLKSSQQLQNLMVQSLLKMTQIAEKEMIRRNK